ncbi:hypothetical protein GH810_04065 [Acetobacterium paludosum]|uniref:Uncharacterized protein n=1 Tax=Acetobacterium paludosum TaxID=52693 RepID=A0A923KNV0_9FIRM|nr:hypothetical protein [Acetobacterium paludosum]MBC3887479.1 hypothetical protein [Acetobacterium paludosum]
MRLKRISKNFDENADAAGIELITAEVASIDAKLDRKEMSEVFGGSPVKK